MVTPAYNIWDTRTSLGVLRESKPEPFYFSQFFMRQMRSTDEWIDFEKLPIRSRQLAPFVKPLGRGRGIALDSVQGYRFKPANIVLEDAIDPLRPLSFQPGIDSSMFDVNKLTPAQRLEMIKAQTMAEYRLACERRWEWMRARAIIDGSVTCTYLDGSSATVNFQRDADHTEVLTGTDRWGQTGVSIMDHFQEILDTMNNARFGGFPTRATMRGAVAQIVRKDTEILKHLDINIRNPAADVTRGLVAGANGTKTYKFGELMVGGGSGAKIELWVCDETYDADNGTATPYIPAGGVVFTADPSAIMGYECFGMIVDQDAEYQALPMFPKNYTTQPGRIKVEHLSLESAPLFVPINPDATYKLTAI